MTPPIAHPPVGPLDGPTGCRRRISILLLLAGALAALAAALEPAPALATAALGGGALTSAAALGFRARWRAAAPPPPAAESARTEDPAPHRPDVTALLRQLHEDYVEKVNAALDAGRDDLAPELSDAYTDQALLLITYGAPTPEPAADPGRSLPLPHHTQEADMRFSTTIRNLLRRFDRYTVEVFQPAPHYRRQPVRSDRGR